MAESGNGKLQMADKWRICKWQIKGRIQMADLRQKMVMRLRGAEVEDRLG